MFLRTLVPFIFVFLCDCVIVFVCIFTLCFCVVLLSYAYLFYWVLLCSYINIFSVFVFVIYLFIYLFVVFWKPAFSIVQRAAPAFFGGKARGKLLNFSFDSLICERPTMTILGLRQAYVIKLPTYTRI